MRGRLLRARPHARARGGRDRGADRVRRDAEPRRERAAVRALRPRCARHRAQRHLMQLFFLILDLALVAAAALLLLGVVIRRGRGRAYLALAILLIALAIGVCDTAIRTPPTGLFRPR